MTLILFLLQGQTFNTSFFVVSEITEMRFAINVGIQNQNNLTYSLLNQLLVKADPTSCIVRRDLRPVPKTI